MRLIKCRKCGATIATDETFVDRMMDAIQECEKMSRKDRRNSSSYLQEAAAIKSIMKAYLHTTAQMDEQYRTVTCELGELVHYIVDEKKVVTYEEIDLTRDRARAKAKAKNEADRKRIEELYGNFRNVSINRTKADPVERRAFTDMRKRQKRERN